MAGFNKITLIGNLGKDPELRYTPDGLAVATFSLAVGEKVKGEEKTTWFKIIAFGKLGEVCGEYLKKGKQIYIEGRLQTSEWVDKEGKARFSLEAVAKEMIMLGSKAADSAAGSSDDSIPAEKGAEDVPF